MSAKLTTEQFIEKAKAIHGDRYDYSSAIYTRAQAKIVIICPDHGEFSQTPNSHLNGRGCPTCGRLNQKRNELGLATFIEKSTMAHGDRYDYSQVEYSNNRAKVVIICPDHGPFEQSPHKHMSGQGCPDCGGTKKLTAEIFIERAKSTHGDFYDYSRIEYENYFEKVIIICPDHGPFQQVPASHIHHGSGCPGCAGNQILTTDQFIQKAQGIHGDRYDYSLVNYVNAYTPCMIVCPDHGPFEQTPANHANHGNECPECVGNKPYTQETLIEKAKLIHGDLYDYSRVVFQTINAHIEIICAKHGPFTQSASHHINRGQGCPACADYGLNPGDPALLYYLAIATENGDTRYKIGITNRTVNARFKPADRQRIRIVGAWQFMVGRHAAEREAEILRLYAGEKYTGPPILSSGNTELFTHDILGLDKQDEEDV